MMIKGDYLKLHFLVFLWGFTAILGKLISLPAVEMVLYRTLIASLGMMVVMYYARSSFAVGTRTIVYLLLTGVLVSLHWLSFFGSARMSNVSVSLVGFATASLWSSLLEPVFNRRRVRIIELVMGLFVVVGIAIIFSFDFRYKLGFVAAIMSGLTAAIFSVINAQFIKKVSAHAITFYEMTGAFLSLLLFLPIYRVTWAEGGILRLAPSAMDWIALLVLSVICTVYAFTVMVELMKRLSVFLIQLTINLEPIYGILMAVIIFGESEKMNVSFYAGAAIILGAVFSYPYLSRKLTQRYEQ